MIYGEIDEIAEVTQEQLAHLMPDQQRCPVCAKDGLPNDLTIDLKTLGKGQGRPHCATCYLKGRFTPLEAMDEDPEIK